MQNKIIKIILIAFIGLTLSSAAHASGTSRLVEQLKAERDQAQAECAQAKADAQLAICAQNQIETERMNAINNLYAEREKHKKEILALKQELDDLETKYEAEYGECFTSLEEALTQEWARHNINAKAGKTATLEALSSIFGDISKTLRSASKGVITMPTGSFEYKEHSKENFNRYTILFEGTIIEG